MCRCTGYDLDRCGPLDNFGVWEPANPRKMPENTFFGNHEFTAFNCYGLSFELAARELARHPEAQEDEDLQIAICRRYGVFLDQCTEDELTHLFNLANEFMGV